MIIAVDFDGTLHDWKNPKSGRVMGPPLEGAESAMKILRVKGHHIVVHSVRGDRPQHIKDWMNYYKIPFDSITNIKPPAEVYIDDCAIRYTNWEDTLTELSKHYPGVI
jgi:hypothetical protein